MRYIYLFSSLAFLSLIIIHSSCNQKKHSTIETKDEHESLNEDSLELANAYAQQKTIKTAIKPIVETDPVEANSMDDAADDPAIWYNRKNPSQSLIFGSNKKGGLMSTDLKGKKVDYYKLGSINNVDIIHNYSIKDSSIVILGCSNRTTQAINLFIIQANGRLIQLSDPTYYMDSTKIDDIYGFCLGQDESENEHYVFINGKNGLMQQYLMENIDDSVKLKLVREIQFDSQTEGMVADNKRGKLYVGEENKGVWIMDINPKSSEKLFINESGEQNKNISYDIEGLSIYEKGNLAYLFVSSQGNFSYAVFDINNDNRYLGNFKIVDNANIDGVEETDGIAIFSDSLNLEFPEGIFVAQDGFNYAQGVIIAQNFKYLSMEGILDSIATLQ